MHGRSALLVVAAGCLESPVLLNDDARLADASPDVSEKCPDNYNSLGTSIGSASFYRFVEQRARWLDAVAICALDRTSGPPFTHLVVLDNDSEREALLPFRAASNDAYWIGVTDLKETGVWRWVTAQPQSDGYPPASGVPWSPNQPMSGANCAVIVGPNYAGVNGLLSADYCVPPATVALPFVCECDAYPNDATRY